MASEPVRWLDVGRVYVDGLYYRTSTSTTIKFDFTPKEGKDMTTTEAPELDSTEATAIRVGALQAVTVLNENLDGSPIPSLRMIGKARELEGWLNNQENKALALEALNAAAVSLGLSGDSDVSTVMGHANAFYDYLVRGTVRR